MKRFFLGGLVVAPLFFLACATGGSSAEDGAGEPVDGDAGEGGSAGGGGKSGKAGASGKGGKGGTSGKGGSAGNSSEGGQGGTLGGGTGGTGGAPSAGSGGSSGKGGSSGSASGKGGSSAGTGGASGKGGSLGTGGTSAGAGGNSAGGGGTTGNAGKGGTSGGAAGANAGSGGSNAGTGGTSAGGGSGGSAAGAAGQGGSSVGKGGAAGSSGGSAGAGGSGPVDACATAIAAMLIDFEQSPPNPNMNVGGLDGFSAGGSWPYVQFQYGTPSAAKAAKGGPAQCAGGTKCLANAINEDYVQCGRSYAVTPTWNLSACAGRSLRLSFDHWYEFSVIPWQGTTYYDGGAVELSGTAGSSWSQGVAAYTGTININGNMGGNYACNSQNSFYVDAKPGFIGTSAGAWVHEDVAIPANLVTSKFAARFIWSSGVSFQTTSPADSRLHSSAGWYIDNIAVRLAP